MPNKFMKAVRKGQETIAGVEQGSVPAADDERLPRSSIQEAPAEPLPEGTLKWPGSAPWLPRWGPPPEDTP